MKKQRVALMNGKIPDSLREDGVVDISVVLFELLEKGYQIRNPENIDELEVVRTDPSKRHTTTKKQLLQVARIVEKETFALYSRFVAAYQEEISRVVSELRSWIHDESEFRPDSIHSFSVRNLNESHSKRQLVKSLSQRSIGANGSVCEEEVQTTTQQRKQEQKKPLRRPQFEAVRRAARKARAKQYFQLEKSAKVIQSMFRSHVERKNFLHLLRVVLSIQRTWRELRDRRQQDIEIALKLIRKGKGLARTNLQITRNEKQRLAIASGLWKGRVTRYTFSRWKSKASLWRKQRIKISSILFRWCYFNLSWALKNWWYNCRNSYKLQTIRDLHGRGTHSVITEYSGCSLVPHPHHVLLGSTTNWVPGTLHTTWLTTAMNRTCDVNRRASLRSSNIAAVATNQSSVLRKSATTTTLHNKSNLVRHGKIQPLPRQLCDEQNTSFDRAQNSIASGVATTSTRSRESTRREQEQLVDSERSREHIPTEYIKQHWYLPPKELERRWELSLLKEVRLREQIEKHWVGELVSFKGELWAKRRRDRNALRGNLRTSISLANIPFDPSYQKRQLSMLNSQN